MAGLGLLSGCGVLLPSAQQPAKVPRLGFLALSVFPANQDAFRQGLRELGYVDGQSIAIEYRYSEGSPERLSALAAELVSLGPDVIVSGGGSEAAAALKSATSTIPIVAPIGDPVASGFVASLAHPGGNLTGLSTVSSATVAKRLQILKETAPSVRRVAVLWNPNNPAKVPELKEAQSGAPSLGLQLQDQEVRGTDDLAGALRAVTVGAADALLVLAEGTTIANRAQIAGFAASNRLPTIYELREFTEAGGLMNYGVNRVDLYRRAATYVDKILKGAKPGDIPIEQPNKFDFIINLKTAEALGLTIPQSVFQQATEVIQ